MANYKKAFPFIDYCPAGDNRAGREKRCMEQPLGFVTDIYIYIESVGGMSGSYIFFLAFMVKRTYF